MTEKNLNSQSGKGRPRGRKNKKTSTGYIAVIVLLLLVLIFSVVLIYRKINSNTTDKINTENESVSKIEDMEIAESETKETEVDDFGVEDAEGNIIETEYIEITVPETEAARDEPIELLFGGDIYLSNYVLNAYDSAGGINGVLCDNYLREIEQSDMFIANQEFPFSDRGEQAPDKQFTFRLSPERINIFTELGLDLVTLANNHSLDFGEAALLDSIDVLDKASIKHMGAGKNKKEAMEPVIVEFKGRKIGFIAASRVIPVSSWAAGKDKPGLFICYDSAELINSVKELESVCDYTIVFLHWGTEKKTVPDSYMEDMAENLVLSGADAVIGSHPHVLQPIEIINGKPVVYSLGNFIFGSRIESTMLFKLIIEDDKISYELLPGKGSMGYTQMLSEPEKEAFIKAFPVSSREIGN
ncbi:MAG: CapA family protein [Eubacteriales bacterium]|nr:CapA family protein [Eubacteriales bacterium]